jgi:RNase P subunit RPR2
MCAESISKSVWNSVSPILLQELSALWVCTHCDDATSNGRPRRNRQQAERAQEQVSASFARGLGGTGGPGRRRWQCATARHSVRAGDGHSSLQTKSCADYRNIIRVRELLAPRARVLGHFLARRTWCRECSAQLTSGPSRTILRIRTDKWNQHTDAVLFPASGVVRPY